LQFVAARATYTDADKARAYVVLTANDGLVKRAARESGIPENTLRRWRDEWAKNGPPATEEVMEAATDFVNEAREVRGMALDVIRQKIQLLKDSPKDAKIAELTTLVGVLTDKVDRAAGLDQGNRVDHYHHLPEPEELRALMGEYVSGQISAAERRAEDIVDAEIVEQPALLPAKK
jgi:transposase-like protein